MDNGRGVRERAIGSIIIVIFGLIFLEADAGALAGASQTAVRVGAFIAALALFALGGRLRRTQAPAGHPALRSAPGSGFGLRYWVVVAAEVVALLTGLMVINAVFRAHELNVPWIAVVVGVHFFGLIPLWDARLHFAVLGVAVTTLGVAGFVLYAAGAPALTLRVVSGIGSGVVLYLAAAHSLLRRSAFGRSPEHGSIDV